MKKRDETEEEFRSRLSQLEAAAEQEDEALDEDEDEVLEAVADQGDGQAEDKKKTQTSKWLIGPGAVSAGSLHCDIWRGKASDLVGHDAIAVHPAPGWWKSHGGKRRFGDSGRYALVLSISADGAEVDLYTDAANVLTTKAALIDLETLIG